MECVDGRWIMYGVDSDDPSCIHTADELHKVIKDVGFLPLFQNEIEGFSVEEMTDPSCWWCGDPEVDPWEWRSILARKNDIVYGKFFNKKAGFISKKWFPYFANYRREGYDFDAGYEDGKVGYRENLIMKLFLPEGVELNDVDHKRLKDFVDNPELFSHEVKALAGFGKGGEKNFEGTCTKLQMETYLVVKDFRQKQNKKGEAYGWAIAVYTLPEYLWGYNFVTSRYKESPEDSKRKIYKQLKKKYSVSERELEKWK